MRWSKISRSTLAGSAISTVCPTNFDKSGAEIIGTLRLIGLRIGRFREAWIILAGVVAAIEASDCELPVGPMTIPISCPRNLRMIPGSLAGEASSSSSARAIGRPRMPPAALPRDGEAHAPCVVETSRPHNGSCDGLDAPVSRSQLSEGRHAYALRLLCALCVHREVKTGTNVCNLG
jgi:hypothetical protein